MLHMFFLGDLALVTESVRIGQRSSVDNSSSGGPLISPSWPRCDPLNLLTVPNRRKERTSHRQRNSGQLPQLQPLFFLCRLWHRVVDSQPFFSQHLSKETNTERGTLVFRLMTSSAMPIPTHNWSGANTGAQMDSQSASVVVPSLVRVGENGVTGEPLMNLTPRMWPALWSTVTIADKPSPVSCR